MSVQQATSDTAAAVRIETLLRFLIGGREAILEIAQAPRALAVGAIFVLSAGLAREYDGADLLREPWHLAIPFAASLVAAWILYSITFLFAWRHGARDVPYVHGFLAYLTLFWMMAPMAWLYAMPHERYLDPTAATEANLWTLAFVALWRVLLISRVTAVLFGCSYFAAFWIVMAVADGVALVALHFSPLPIMNVMSGVRASGAEAVLISLGFLASVLAFLSLPVWLFGLCGLIVVPGLRWAWQLAKPSEKIAVARGPWMVALIAVVAGLFTLPFTQPQQWRRGRIERQLRRGQLDEAMETLTRYPRDAFPPHWDLPPRLIRGEATPDVIQCLDRATQEGTPLWVRSEYIDKVRREFFTRYGRSLSSLDNSQLELLVDCLERLPEGPEMVTPVREELNRHLHDDDPYRRELVIRLLSIGDVDEADRED